MITVFYKTLNYDLNKMVIYIYIDKIEKIITAWYTIEGIFIRWPVYIFN